MAKQNDSDARPSRLQVGLDPELMKQVRIAAAFEGCSVPDFVDKLIRPAVEKIVREKAREVAAPR